MIFSERPYQEETIIEVKKALNAGKNTLIQLPTGAGKAYILCRVANDLLIKFPQFRVLILVDREILIRQLAKTMKLVNHNILVGIACAGVSSDINTNQQVTIATRQTIKSRLDSLKPINLLISDEAHLWRLQEVNKPPNGQFAEIYSRLRECNPKMRLLGCSATCYTLQGGYIYGDKHKPGLKPYFGSLTCKISYRELTPEYLAPLVGKVVDSVNLELNKISLVSGEYNIGQLSSLMQKHITSIKDAIKLYCKDRKKILVFAVDIAHAETIHQALPESTILHSHLSDDEQNKNLDLFTNNDRSILISVNQIAIGFDYADVDCVILARPTKSPGLALQFIGRGLRTSDGKKDCLVIDLVGITNEHFVNHDLDQPIVKIPWINANKKNIILKTCPDCELELHPAVRVCPKCNHEWTREDVDALMPNLKDIEFNTPKPSECEWMLVNDFVVESHISQKSNKILGKIKFEVGSLYRPRIVNEFFCFADKYGGYAVESGTKRWANFSSNPYPKTINEFMQLSNTLEIPVEILVDFSDRWPKIKDYRFIDKNINFSSDKKLPF